MMQIELISNFVGESNPIESKVLTIHPPQALNPEARSLAVRSGSEIRFMFVGASFFRKGGMEIVRVLARIRKRYGYPLRLIVVSNLQNDSYATRESAGDVAEAIQLLSANSDWLDWIERIDNRRVLALMAQSHIGLLPTHADTYGFSVLEFQASGCPVISTDVRALPEINNGEVGWIIPVKKNRFGEAIYTTETDREDLSAAIESGLENSVHEIYSNISALRHRSEASVHRIRTDHDPAEYGRRLLAVYEGAL
jgi:glycosyltransferase involved in cell wall biosynthesis